ncbi:mCG147218 [Mus musculus]|nr:mCG147218 [Mus musculus]
MRMEEDGVPQSEVKGIPELVPVRVQESPHKPQEYQSQSDRDSVLNAHPKVGRHSLDSGTECYYHELRFRVSLYRQKPIMNSQAIAGRACRVIGLFPSCVCVCLNNLDITVQVDFYLA